MDVKEMYFKKPTQVKYYNYVGDFDEDTPDEQKYGKGIAYNGEVICACCDTVIPLSTILRQAEIDDFNVPIIAQEWWEPLKIKEQPPTKACVAKWLRQMTANHLSLVRLQPQAPYAVAAQLV